MSSETSKKRKRAPVVLHQNKSPVLDTSKPTHVFQKPVKGRQGTLSIAIPGSIIANAPGLELKTVLAGRIARAAAVFCVDEIVIFDDGQSNVTQERAQHRPSYNDASYSARQRNGGFKRGPDELLELLLSYAECPPYLRKNLFESHPDLGKAGMLPPLDIPHHLKPDEWCEYREGVALGPAENNYSYSNKKSRSASQIDPKNLSTVVDVGFEVSVAADIPPYTRLTVKLQQSTSSNSEDNIKAEAVDPEEPRKNHGYYWGYTVRRAASISDVFTSCPFQDGYDISIGTSERGDNLEKYPFKSGSESLPTAVTHALIVFGGVAGLEVAVEADGDLKARGINSSNVGDLFDFYVNTCPGQGSRTIRAEEALWITLAQLRSWVVTAVV